MREHLERQLTADPDAGFSPEVCAILERLRTTVLAVTQLFDEAMPDCWEKSRALSALQEASMWARKALRQHDSHVG